MVDAASFASSVPVPFIDAAGCHIPAFADIYAALQADYRSIYGPDVVLDPDTTDGNWLGIQARAMSDYCAAFEAAYNARSPATAVGAGLSSVVKINGVARKAASYSTVDLDVVGTVGTVLSNAVASDGVRFWSLPASVTIPPAGTVTVTATCQTLGAVVAEAGTVAAISTPTRGWQSVSNPAAATPGAPVELDPALRQRQTQSTMLPSSTVLDGIEGALMALPGVKRAMVVDNTGNVTDANGLPGHSIAAVVDGGDAQAIGAVIAAKKTPGGGTYGTATVVVTSKYGVARDISFFRPTLVPITFVVRVRALKGFTLDIKALLQRTMADWTSALPIGAGVGLADSYTPAKLITLSDDGEFVQNPAASTFKPLSVALARDGLPTAPADAVLAFNEAAYGDPTFVQVVVS